MIQGQAICTIIAKNYLAFARTLAQSFRSFHPNHKCYVLIVDDFAGLINPDDESFEVITLADLNIPNLQNLCFKYDVQELCTAVKARLMEYLIHEKSVDRLLYLDPDILVTDPLVSIYERLATYDIVLTPHLDTDFPNDGLLPNDGHILRAGLFNLGFIATNSSENARSFLNWWKPKLDEKCVVDLMNGYFVDQKFIDFVPLFFKNVFIEKDVGYNVAYWNLHSRRLSRDNGKWMCNDGPLYFFHFSGYSPKSKAISRHLPEMARFGLADRPDLQPLFSEYDKLLAGNGHDRARTWSYTYNFFQSGNPIPRELRVYYRNCPSAWGRNGDPFASKELERSVVDHSDLNSGPLLPAPARELEAREPATETLAAELMAKEFRLNAILNSRAWLWVNRYGRFKKRYLQPSYDFFGRLGGAKSKRAVIRQPEDLRLESNGFPGTRESRIPCVPTGSVCFCTLAISAPYRQRARLLCADASTVPWIVLTDEPDDFADLPVRTIRHVPTGPMAADYLKVLSPTGDGRGAAAYHDKRFALLAALENFDTAIYLDADSRVSALTRPGFLPSGLAVLPVVRKSVAEHLETCGSWRLPVFIELARHLTGDTAILQAARWCHETFLAVTKDGRESRFFEAWSVGADFLQSRGVYSGEGGVIGLAAAYAGWSVDYEALQGIAAAIQHEGGGPKEA